MLITSGNTPTPSISDAPVVAAAPTRVKVDAPAPPVAPAVKATSTQQPTPEQLQAAVQTINQVMMQSHQSVEFSVDSVSKVPVMRMTDTQTGEVIRQYPTEQALAISRSIAQHQTGALLSQKV